MLRNLLVVLHAVVSLEASSELVELQRNHVVSRLMAVLTWVVECVQAEVSAAATSAGACTATRGPTAKQQSLRIAQMPATAMASIASTMVLVCVFQVMKEMIVV